jgi:hypothetical protein
MPQSERKMPTPRPASKTEVIGPFRCTPQDKERIYELARERNMDVTAFVTDAALGRLDEDFVGADELWRDSIESRIKRLEDLAYGQ